ncbi:hypothetical protein [Luteolibacter sp. LG18]|uniref:hypothetical protein n=1 Tax=Luteolibacter sp. LG18 TaxID=2819286 RepID=UPI0030C68945
MVGAEAITSEQALSVCLDVGTSYYTCGMTGGLIFGFFAGFLVALLVSWAASHWLAIRGAKSQPPL